MVIAFQIIHDGNYQRIICLATINIQKKKKKKYYRTRLIIVACRDTPLTSRFLVTRILNPVEAAILQIGVSVSL